MKFLIGMCVVAVAACSSSNSHSADAPGNGSGSGSGGGGSCMLTLSGAQSGTYSCMANAAWASSNNQGGIGIPVSGFSGMINIAAGWPGEPTATTYHSTDANAKGGASVVTGSGTSTMAWAASVGGNGAPMGSYTVTLTSVDNPITTGTGKGYTVHGSFTATLVPETGQSGSIMMSATF